MYVLPDHLPNPEGVPRILTRAQALALGFTRHAVAHRLETRRWHLILPGVYLTGSMVTRYDRLAAALAFAGPGALLTGSAALEDLGLRSVRRSDLVLVLVPYDNRRRPAGWVRLRRTRRLPERWLHPGPARVEPARAVADLALERARLDDVRALTSQAVRARLCTIEQLWGEYEAGPRQVSAHLRRALEDLDAGAWSAPEAHAAELLRKARIPAFEPNAPIDLPWGGRLWVDFLWPQLRAVLEIDSDEHHWKEPEDRDATLDRHTVLHIAGYSTISRRPEAIRRQPAKFQRDVELWLAARARELAA